MGKPLSRTCIFPSLPADLSPPSQVITVVLCVWVLSLTFASTAYVASLASIEETYNISQEAAILGVSLMVLGFAVAPLAFGPATEVFGRRPVYQLTGLLYSAFSFGAAFAPNAAALLIFRFLAGFWGSASINCVPASLGDISDPRLRGVLSIVYATCAFGGPSLGPLISAFIQTEAGWHWNLRVIAIFSTVTSLLAAFVPETHGPTILKRQIAKAGNAPRKLSTRQLLAVFRVAVSRPIMYLFTEPIVAVVSLYLSVVSSGSWARCRAPR